MRGDASAAESAFSSTQYLRKAELVPIGVLDVKIPLSPRPVPRWLRLHPFGKERCVQVIDPFDPKDQAPPPASDMGRRQNEVEKSVPQTETGELGLRAAV